MSMDLTPQGVDGSDNRNQLTIRERVMIEQYIHQGGDKVRSYSLAFMERSFDSLTVKEKMKCRARGNKKWKEIEDKLGGIKGVLEEMGLDDVTLIRETIRLANTQRPMISKAPIDDGSGNMTNIIWYPDGPAQAKAIEMFHRMKGNLDGNKLHQKEKSNPLKIEFSNFGELTSADNVEISIGKKNQALIENQKGADNEN